MVFIPAASAVLASCGAKPALDPGGIVVSYLTYAYAASFPGINKEVQAVLHMEDGG